MQGYLRERTYDELCNVKYSSKWTKCIFTKPYSAQINRDDTEVFLATRT